MQTKCRPDSCVGKCILVLLLSLTGFSVGSVEVETNQISLIDRQLEQMQALDRKLISSHPEKDMVRNRGLADFYRKRFTAYQATEVLANMPDGDLRALMIAAQLAAFYSYDDTILDDAMTDLRLLDKRGLARTADFGEAYRLLIGNRRFDDARMFLDKHPSLNETPPPLLLGLRPGWHGAAEMRIGDAARTLVWTPVDLGKLPRIVVIGHPLCHFTQNAIRAIEADPTLNVLFARHAKWLAPQDQTTDFGLFGEWNLQHPEAATTITYRAAEFTLIDNWSTPMFYFIDDGRVVARITGWPKEGRRAEILAAYQAAFERPQPTSTR